MVDALPEGWTIERIRMLSGDAALLPLDRVVLLERFGEADYEALTPRVIISFTGLCLVWGTVDDEWYMEQLDSDGSIICWASYGRDLGNAIAAL